MKLYVSSPNFQSLYDTVNIGLQKVTKWLHTNKLTVNNDKSNYVVFIRKKNPIEESLEIYLHDIIINLKETAKFLGVYINESLCWKEHSVTVAKTKF